MKTKKKVFTKNETLFFPEFKWSPALRRRPESNYWRGDAAVDHTQIIGGGYSQIIGGRYTPRVSSPLLEGRVGAGFYAKYPNNSPKQAFFHLGICCTLFQAGVLSISEVAKNLLLEKCTIKVLLCWLIVMQLSKHS